MRSAPNACASKKRSGAPRWRRGLPCVPTPTRCRPQTGWSSTTRSLRQERLARLAEANAVLEARTAARDAQEAADDAAKVQEREDRARRNGRKPGGRPPKLSTHGPWDKDQDNVTDPESRIMKHRTDAGFAQSDHVQVAVDQARMVIVGRSHAHHPTDPHEIPPTVSAIPPDLGRAAAAAMDAG